ncbi:MAG: hypothetical protein JWN44_125 [Myxococcales bacterium]|nr:hypothetical protein [Myxococcales bacterium]
MNLPTSSSLRLFAGLVSLGLASSAGAHISLEQGGTHMSRSGDANLKQGPCGLTGSTRGTHVYTYAPGATIVVSVVETITHPSYFRFAFDTDGDDGFKEPASIKPIDPKRKCPIDSGDHCGAADFYNSPEVLPNMDNLNAHLAGSGTPKYTFGVTLPNVECANCTLQIIQVMEDDLFHGDYDPTPGVGVEDIYHQCIDITLKAGAPMTNVDGGVPTFPDMAVTGGGGSGGSGGSGGGGGTGSSGGTTGKGGCAMSGAADPASMPALLSMLSLLALISCARVARRRRRLDA